MRHSCSSSVSGLVITNISLLSTSCFNSSRPPCAFTTTVSQVSLNFFRSCARPWACTRILWNTRPLRRGVAEVTSVIGPSSTARPLPSIAHPSGCSPTATWPKAANECLCHGWHRGWSDPQQVPPKKDPTHQQGQRMHLSGGGYGKILWRALCPSWQRPSWGRVLMFCSGSWMDRQLSWPTLPALPRGRHWGSNLVPAAWQVFEAYALDHQQIYPCPHELLVSCWPLVQGHGRTGMFSRIKPKHAKNSSKKRLLAGSRK